jgi:Zn-dependent protease
LSDLEISLYMLVGLIIGMIFHEYMHALVAYKMGDTTAKQAGRLTLDPLAHIDPFGTLILPGVLFVLRALGLGTFIIGYAKPVPINPFYFRRRTGIIWVSLAGPLTNLAIGVIFLGFAKVAAVALAPSGLQDKLITTLVYISYINVILFVFNLIPIPPLDGSKIVGYFLKGESRRFYQSIEPFGIFIILIFISFFGVIFSSITLRLYEFLLSLFRL